MKKILLICTGGTIASRKTDDGLTPQISAEDILSYVPEARRVCHIDAIQVCNIDSTNMTPEHWRLLVETVEAHYEDYDGFVFCHNEALLYEWIEENDPELFCRIQKLVKEGKWHIMGGWYLQPDCNLVSGESFVRQILAVSHTGQCFRIYFL